MISDDDDRGLGVKEEGCCLQCGKRHVQGESAFAYCSRRCAERAIDADRESERIADIGPPMSTKTKMQCMASALACLLFAAYLSHDLLTALFEIKLSNPFLIAACVIAAAVITDTVDSGLDPEKIEPTSTLLLNGIYLKTISVLLWLQMLHKSYTANSSDSPGLIILILVIMAPVSAFVVGFLLSSVFAGLLLLLLFLRRFFKN